MRPRTKAVAAAVMLAFTALQTVSGCGRVPDPVEVTAETSASEQRLAVGQELRVALNANPSTGYQWVVDGELPAVLEQAGEPEYTVGSMALGAMGTDTWTFRAAEAGTGLLRMKYWRSFESTSPPIEEFELKVIVE